jgi:formamidopyrimidine-DNA glycosylase
MEKPMPEYPEIFSRAAEMQQVLPGRSIRSITILQEKCLNLPATDFNSLVLGQTFQKITSHGKWIIAEITEGTLLLNLGMGGEVFFHKINDPLPEKKRVILHMEDGTKISINFWWFGYCHYVPQGKLQEHSMFSILGPDVMQISAEDFAHLVSRSKQRIKTLLLDQKRLAGIGNYYIHDILFKAGIHPLTPAHSLSPAQIETLYTCMRAELQSGVAKGGADYEYNLWGGKGAYETADLLVGYKEGCPCPICQTEIMKISTGSTTSYICPTCQPVG